LTVGLATAAGKAGAPTRTFDFGKAGYLAGRLTAPSGDGIGGADLSVVAQREGSSRRVLAVVHTAADGRYSLKLGADVSRDLVVRFAGNDALGPAGAQAKQNFRAGMTLKAGAKSVRRGGRLRLRGRVKLLSASLPARGIRVDVEFCPRKRCTSLNLTQRSDSDGGYELDLPTGGLSRGSTFRFRAKVSTEGGWPFADGVSPLVTVKVSR
jgi:hypothetical protein